MRPSRLLYVGMTRAQVVLYLTFCESRWAMGTTAAARAARLPARWPHASSVRPGLGTNDAHRTGSRDYGSQSRFLVPFTPPPDDADPALGAALASPPAQAAWSAITGFRTAKGALLGGPAPAAPPPKASSPEKQGPGRCWSWAVPELTPDVLRDWDRVLHRSVGVLGRRAQQTWR